MTFIKFYGFCKCEFNEEQVHFLVLVREFRNEPVAMRLMPRDLMTLSSRGDFIYDQCIRVGANMEINIGADITGKMRHDYGPFIENQQSFFDVAYKQVLQLVEYDAWIRFEAREQTTASAPVSGRKAAPAVPRRAAALTILRSTNILFTSALAGVMSSPLLRAIELPVAGPAALPAHRAFTPPTPLVPAPPMYASSPASCAAAAAARAAFPAASSAVVYQTPVRRWNPPPPGKRLISRKAQPLPEPPVAELLRNQNIKERGARLDEPLPAPPPPTSPVPAVRPVFAKPGPKLKGH